MTRAVLLNAIIAPTAIACRTSKPSSRPSHAAAPIVTTPVYPFGPRTYTTSASTAFEPPNRVREQVITDASAFCKTQGERSLPIEINLVTTHTQNYSNVAVHSATVVFRCFDPSGLNESKEQI